MNEPEVYSDGELFREMARPQSRGLPPEVAIPGERVLQAQPLHRVADFVERVVL